MHGFLTVHCSNCFSRASESPSAGHSSFRNTSTSAIHFFKVLTSFWGGETRTGTEIQSESLDSQTTCHNPSNPSHLKLHQFGHELLDSLGVVCQRGAKSSPACHDGVHLSAIPTENYRSWSDFDIFSLPTLYWCRFPEFPPNWTYIVKENLDPKARPVWNHWRIICTWICIKIPPRFILSLNGPQCTTNYFPYLTSGRCLGELSGRPAPQPRSGSPPCPGGLPETPRGPGGVRERERYQLSWSQNTQHNIWT